jgi:hypothetical protein
MQPFLTSPQAERSHHQFWSNIFIFDFLPYSTGKMPFYVSPDRLNCRESLGVASALTQESEIASFVAQYTDSYQFIQPSFDFPRLLLILALYGSKVLF